MDQFATWAGMPIEVILFGIAAYTLLEIVKHITAAIKDWRAEREAARKAAIQTTSVG